MAEEARDIRDRVADVFELPDEDEDGVRAGEEAEDEEEREEPEDEEVEASDEEEAEDEPEEDDDESEEGLVEVEYDGVLYEVPSHLKDALMRASDYTQKTQEVAQQRKSTEVTLGELERRQKDYEFAESIWDDAMKVQVINDQVDQYNAYLRQNLDSLGSSDIERVRFHMDELKDQQHKLQQDIQNKHKEHQQAQEQSRAELLKKGTEVLRQRIPGWGDQTAKQVKEYALTQGFTEQEVNNLVDPRGVEVMYKAAMYDTLKKDAKPVRQKLEKAPAIKTKARNTMPKETRRKLDTKNQLKKKGLSHKAKAKVIENDLANRLGLTD